MNKKINYLISFFQKKLKILKDINFLFGIIFLTILLFFILFKKILNLPDPFSCDYKILQNINSKHWMGTDDTGYDLFTRFLEGAKISLQISFFVIIISSFIGVFLGIISGYFQGFIDNIIIFLCDFLTVIPDIILAILIMLLLNNQQSIKTLVIVLSISYIPSYIRIIRANTLIIKQKDFIKASKALGANQFQIIKRHVFPNILTNLITKMILNMSNVILAISGLGFIGLGLDRTKPEWGNILYSSKNYIMNYPNLFYGPFIIIFLTILSFNLIGKSLIKKYENKQNSY